jgi:hypothetical protein
MFENQVRFFQFFFNFFQFFFIFFILEKHERSSLKSAQRCRMSFVSSLTSGQSYGFDLQRRRCKNWQRNYYSVARF